MNKLLLVWVSLSLSGTLVTLAILLIKSFLKKFSKTWHYYIWLLVILRLIIPFTPDISLVGNLFQQTETHMSTLNSSVEDSYKNENATSINQLTLPHNNDTNQITPPSSLYDVVVSFVRSNLLQLIFGLCIIISILLFSRKIYHYQQFVKAVKKESSIVNDNQINSILQKICTEMRIKRKVSIHMNLLIQAPMLIGTIAPIITLPIDTVSKSPKQELECIIKHELTHYRRMDFIYKWLTEIAVCLHWFNPIVYWVRKQINKDCELSCDENVISHLSLAGRHTYGETLLNSIKINQAFRLKSSVGSLSLTEDTKLIKERMNSIMKYKAKSKLVIIISTLLTIVLLCGTVYAGSYSLANENKSNENKIIINNKSISSGGKISLGEQQLSAVTTCKISLRWKGSNSLTALITSTDSTEKSYVITNGKTSSIEISKNSKYTVAVKNNNKNSIKNITGTINFDENTVSKKSKDITDNYNLTSTQSSNGTVVYEAVVMQKYDGADGHPYAHDVKTNNTDKTITGMQRGMLAFDKDGNPLKIGWNGVSLPVISSYYHLYETDMEEILPSKTNDIRGGWSLNVYGKDKEVEKIAYVIYCDKQITFEDGTVWDNPDFENWLDTYNGKKVRVDTLKNYYPYIQKVI